MCVPGAGRRFPISELTENRGPEKESGLKHKYRMLAAVSGAVILADQITKVLVEKTLALHQSIEVIPGFFSLTHVLNPGGAFGFLARQSASVRRLIFLGATLGAMGLILYLYRKTPPTYNWLLAGFALIFGGAVGNLIDRIRMGKVVDFLDFYIGTLHWPAFNVADSAVSIGVTIFLFHLIFNKLPD